MQYINNSKINKRKFTSYQVPSEHNDNSETDIGGGTPPISVSGDNLVDELNNPIVDELNNNIIWQ